MWFVTVDEKALVELTEEIMVEDVEDKTPGTGNVRGSDNKLEVYGLVNGGGGSSSLSNLPDPNSNRGS